MSLAEYLKENQIDDIGDDQEFMDAEYNAVRTFCEIYGYSLTDADLKTVKSRELEESFGNRQELYVEGL